MAMNNNVLWTLSCLITAVFSGNISDIAENKSSVDVHTNNSPKSTQSDITMHPFVNKRLSSMKLLNEFSIDFLNNVSSDLFVIPLLSSSMNDTSANIISYLDNYDLLFIQLIQSTTFVLNLYNFRNHIDALYQVYPELNTKINDFVRNIVYALGECNDLELFQKICADTLHSFQSRETNSKRAAMEHIGALYTMYFTHDYPQNLVIDINSHALEVVVSFWEWCVRTVGEKQLNIIVSSNADTSEMMVQYSDIITKLFQGTRDKSVSLVKHNLTKILHWKSAHHILNLKPKLMKLMSTKTLKVVIGMSKESMIILSLLRAFNADVTLKLKSVEFENLKLASDYLHCAYTTS